MAMHFKNPANGYVEDVSYAPLWCLLVGFFYFAAKGVWTHVVAGAVLAVVTCGLSWFIYPFFANELMRTHYLRRGWIDVAAAPPASPAPPQTDGERQWRPVSAGLTTEKNVSFWDKDIPLSKVALIFIGVAMVLGTPRRGPF